MRIYLAGLVEVDYSTVGVKRVVTSCTLSLIHSGHEFNLFESLSADEIKGVADSVEQALDNQSKLGDSHD